MGVSHHKSQAIFSGTVANFLGLVLPLILGVYSIPEIIAKLGIDRFGVLTLVWAIIGYFGLLDFGISRAITKRVAELGEQAIIGAAVRAGICLLFCIGCILGFILGSSYIIAEAGGYLQTDNELKNSALLISISMPLVLLGLGLRGVLEGRLRFAASNWGRVMLGVAAFGAPLVLLDEFARLDVLVAALIVGRILTVLLQAWACRIELQAAWHAQIDHNEFRNLLHFGGWMMISNLVSPLMIFLDRFIVGASSHASNLAYYSTPFEVVTRLLIFPGAVTTALFPKFAHMAIESKDSAILGMVRGMGLMIILVMPMVLLIQFYASDLLMIWLGHDFATKAALPLQILAWGVLFNSLAQFPFTFLQGIGKPKWIALLHLIELPFYLVILVTLLDRWGVVGVAAAWLIRAAADGIILSCLAARFGREQQNLHVYLMLALSLLLGSLWLWTDDSASENLTILFVACLSSIFVGWKIVVSGLAK